MTISEIKMQSEDIASRLGRLPCVLLLTVSLLFSLIHCATCDLAFAGNDGPAVAMNIDQSSVPDTPEQPCHHCLSHVTAQQVNAFTGPADLIPITPPYFREQFRASPSGLTLFKPPRA